MVWNYQNADCSFKLAEHLAEQDRQILQIGQYTHLLPICHRNSWYMAWDGHWAHTRDWQAYHHYHRRHPGDNIPFPTPFHGSAKRKCGFFPQHHGNRRRLRIRWALYRVARKNVQNFRMALCNRVDKMKQQKSMYVMSKHLRICLWIFT